MVLSYVLYKNAIVDLCYYFYFCINIKINLFLKSVFQYMENNVFKCR